MTATYCPNRRSLVARVIAFQQAYAEMAWLCYGIPIGDPIIVTTEQDAFLVEAANEYLADQREAGK